MQLKLCSSPGHEALTEKIWVVVAWQEEEGSAVCQVRAT